MGVGARVSKFFTRNLDKNIFVVVVFWSGRGARVSEFFYKEPKSK